MNKKQGAKKISKIFSYLLVVLIFILVLGFLAFFTNGFTSDFKTFYVVVDGKDILTSSSDYVLDKGTPLVVDIKYTFGLIHNDISGYKVMVVPNIIKGKDFDFIMDNEVYSYQAEKDLTEGFDITYEQNKFSIKPKGGIKQILSSVYPNKQIEDCLESVYINMYSLIIYSNNNEKSVIINFSITEYPPGVILDKEVIVF